MLNRNQRNMIISNFMTFIPWIQSLQLLTTVGTRKPTICCHYDSPDSHCCKVKISDILREICQYEAWDFAFSKHSKFNACNIYP